jgi:hypothetical protein
MELDQADILVWDVVSGKQVGWSVAALCVCCPSVAQWCKTRVLTTPAHPQRNHTCVQVARLQYHSSLVRDCSWHPFEPELTSVSWEGRVVSWGPQLPQQQQRLPRSDRDVLRGYY